jgi:hypothetical protein
MPAPKFGTRFFVILFVRMMAEYLRHKPNIDSDLGPTVAAALDVLVANYDAIVAANPKGPE